jgi:hypothetical protein
MKFSRIPSLAFALLIAAALPAQADELADLARPVFETNKDSVISIRAVLSINFGGGADEQEREANATVIAADGLSVLSLTAIDPTVMMQRLHGNEGEIVSKVTTLKMILPGGAEIDGEVVLRDRDLDLVFVRPLTKPEEPMAHVDLENIGDAQVLDNLLFIGQMGKVARRAHITFIERVIGIVERPVKFYMVGEDRSQAVACSPCFTLEGGFVGIGVLRAIRTAGSMSESPIVIIAAAEDIKTAMKQVPDWNTKIEDETASTPETAEDAETAEDTGTDEAVEAPEDEEAAEAAE